MIVQKPAGFEFIELVSGTSYERGYTIVEDNRTTHVGEESDIVQYVQHYFFDQESGQLTIKLKNECVLQKYNDCYPVELNKPVINPIDAILNQLAMRTFKMPVAGADETFGLIDGSKTEKTGPRLYHFPGYVWSRMYYDRERTKQINFAEIKHFAFDKGSYRLADNGNSFTITLENKHKNNPGVLYALHDILERCGITQIL